MKLVTAMTAYNQPDALAEVLRQYGSDYFDEITVDKETNADCSYVDCQKGANTLRIELPKTTASSTAILRYTVIEDGETSITLRYSQLCNGIHQILVSDNALVFFTNGGGLTSSTYAQYGTLYFNLVILCKNSLGDLCLVYCVDNSAYIKSPYSGNDQNCIAVLTLGQKEREIRYFRANTNTSDFSLCYPVAGKRGVCKGVYWCADRCFNNVVQPFLFHHDGQTLCSIGYQTFCIKTT